MPKHELTTPLRKEDIRMLRAGDAVLLNGVIFTARDSAHKRMVELLAQGRELPFNPEGAVIYYVGPTPPPVDGSRPIGSAGPTTSGRMDAYAPRLHALGVRASIGKGKRSPEVLQALQDYGAVYFGATGGAGALLSLHIEKAELLAFPELGPEAIYKLVAKNFPLVVIADSFGNNLYAETEKL